jgi:ectoine hydroxylase-related dioxygenase (phytanoyl-CoA dioxygenase family)
VENQKPVYWVEKSDETLGTSDSLEADQIKAEWERRGYTVTKATVDPDTAQEVTK